MHAQIGDRIVVRSNHIGDPDQDGIVVEVRGPDGEPPYRVRWRNTGHETLFFPGSDATIEPAGPSSAS